MGVVAQQPLPYPRGSPSRGCRLDRRLQQPATAFHQRHAEPHRLRACPHSAAHHKPRYQTRQGTRGMKPDGDGFADAVLPAQRRARLQAAPPASRVATAIAARRAYGPPLTPQPLRPLTAQSARAGAQPLPARTARRSAHIKIKPLQTKSLRFEGIATRPAATRGVTPWVSVV